MLSFYINSARNSFTDEISNHSWSSTIRRYKVQFIFRKMAQTLQFLFFLLRIEFLVIHSFSPFPNLVVSWCGFSRIFLYNNISIVSGFYRLFIEHSTFYVIDKAQTFEFMFFFTMNAIFSDLFIFSIQFLLFYDVAFPEYFYITTFQ